MNFVPLLRIRVFYALYFIHDISSRMITLDRELLITIGVTQLGNYERKREPVLRFFAPCSNVEIVNCVTPKPVLWVWPFCHSERSEAQTKSKNSVPV